MGEEKQEKKMMKTKPTSDWHGYKMATDKSQAGSYEKTTKKISEKASKEYGHEMKVLVIQSSCSTEIPPGLFSFVP